MNEKDMMHGFDWGGEDLTGYVLSEKFDGCRAYWDGETLWSRGGLPVALPNGWRLPVGFALDCELYDGHDGLRRCSTAIRYSRISAQMALRVFDAPAARGTWIERMEAARAALAQCHGAVVVEWEVCQGTEHALSMMRGIKAAGGEGVIARQNAAPYLPGRSGAVLKLKGMVA